jgi:hypothetical protein
LLAGIWCGAASDQGRRRARRRCRAPQPGGDAYGEMAVSGGNRERGLRRSDTRAGGKDVSAKPEVEAAVPDVLGRRAGWLAYEGRSCCLRGSDPPEGFALRNWGAVACDWNGVVTLCGVVNSKALCWSGSGLLSSVASVSVWGDGGKSKLGCGKWC